MKTHLNETSDLFVRQSKILLSVFTTVLMLLVILIPACQSTQSEQNYANPENGIRLKKPSNWDLTYVERNGVITLRSQVGSLQKDMARIEIDTPDCPQVSGKASYVDNRLDIERLESDIERIRILYDLSSVEILEKPTKVKIGRTEAATALIAIPTMSMLDDKARIQVGDPGTGVKQMIRLQTIRVDNQNYIMTYLYFGNNETLNVEAQKIIDTVQRSCTAQQ